MVGVWYMVQKGDMIETKDFIDATPINQFAIYIHIIVIRIINWFQDKRELKPAWVTQVGLFQQMKM